MRSMAHITVTCDLCGIQTIISLTPTARGFDERNVNKDLEAEGWNVDNDLCPYCKRNGLQYDGMQYDSNRDVINR